MVAFRILLASLALGGCVKAPPSVDSVPPSPPPSLEPSAHSATISGIVRDRNTDETLEGALVILQSSALIGARETTTNARGLYLFRDLPAGVYTVQILFAQADASKVTTLPEGSKFRANFSIDPDQRIIACGFGTRREPNESLFSIGEQEARLLRVSPTKIFY